tara:strand:- start:421 stop:618 length:198 start_codon:yes stop_codon:yes gene_type:complete
MMKLQQGQIWQKGNNYYRITEWSRMIIQYKHTQRLDRKEGEVVEVSKKEFCRLLKDATLVDPSSD